MQNHRKVWGFRLNTKHLPRGRHLRAQRVLLSLTKRIALFITTSTAQTHTFSKWTRLPSKQTPMPIPFEKPAQVFQYDRTSYRGKVQIRTLTKAAEIKWRIIIERCMNATQLFKGMLLISGTTRIRWIASQQSLTLASEAEPCHSKGKKEEKKQTNEKQWMPRHIDIAILGRQENLCSRHDGR